MPIYKMRCCGCDDVTDESITEHTLDAGETTHMREACPLCGSYEAQRLPSINRVADMTVAWSAACRGDDVRYAK